MITGVFVGIAALALLIASASDDRTASRDTRKEKQ